MHKSATKCNETIGKWCKNKLGASKIIDTFETYQATVAYTGDSDGPPFPTWILAVLEACSHMSSLRITRGRCHWGGEGVREKECWGSEQTTKMRA
jgi:hypothetical protein